MSRVADGVVSGIVDDYEDTVKNMWEKAESAEGRALGGYLRSEKGALVERMAEGMVRAGWRSAGGEGGSLEIDKSKSRVPIDREYVESLSRDKVRWHVKENIEEYYYDISVDLHVHVGGSTPLVVECKSYTENAMMKRILVDCQLLAGALDDQDPVFVLFQLESQLGGDYSELPPVELGSSSTHTLMSHFPDVDLEIMTLLEGERKVDRPIHDPKHYKPVEAEVVRSYIGRFGEILQSYVT